MYNIQAEFNGGADTYYVAVPIASRIVKATSVVTTQDVATAGKTLTISDGTTDSGVITIAVDAVEGDVDNIAFDSTSLGKVEFGPSTPIKVVLAGAGNGKFNVSFLMDEFHGSI